MKILLDENLDFRLRKGISPVHETHTVRWLGWASKKNGELLALMYEHGYQVLITADKGLYFQQTRSLAKYPITVVLLVANELKTPVLMALMPKVDALLNEQIPAGLIVIQADK